MNDPQRTSRTRPDEEEGLLYIISVICVYRDIETLTRHAIVVCHLGDFNGEVNECPSRNAFCSSRFNETQAFIDLSREKQTDIADIMTFYEPIKERILFPKTNRFTLNGSRNMTANCGPLIQFASRKRDFHLFSFAENLPKEGDTCISYTSAFKTCALIRQLEFWTPHHTLSLCLNFIRPSTSLLKRKEGKGEAPYLPVTRYRPTNFFLSLCTRDFVRHHTSRRCGEGGAETRL